jgi:glycosyltransferase involved in cell wall biosynthesis
MNTTPLVSVILGAYNGEKYLEEQLDSIVRQTYPNIEIIIADDCSTDGTPGILKKYSEKYENITVYYNEKNLGLIRNFENAVQYANGEYIAFADQDDVWLLEKIQCQMDNIGDNTLIYSDSEYIDAQGNSMGKKISDYRNLISGKNLFALEATGGIWIAAHAILFRRKLLDIALPFNRFVNHDGWLAYIAMLEGTIAVIPRPLVLYRQHGGNAVGGLGCHKMMKAKVDKVKPDMTKQRVGEYDSYLSRIQDREPEFRLFLTKMKIYTLNPTFVNRIKRMFLRFKYINQIYAPRKRNVLRRAFKILKLF